MQDMKAKAHQAVSRSRLIQPRTCEGCGRTPKFCSPWTIVAHHDDYSRPLDVRWLCQSCHKRHHLNEARKAGNLNYGTKPYEPIDSLEPEDWDDYDPDYDGRYCYECGGRGWKVTCPDDLCHGQDECIHGDPPTPCRSCNADGSKDDNY